MWREIRKVLCRAFTKESRFLWGMVKFHIGGIAREATKGCPNRCDSCADGTVRMKKERKKAFV
jgi:hypothetical protein